MIISRYRKIVLQNPTSIMKNSQQNKNRGVLLQLDKEQLRKNTANITLKAFLLRSGPKSLLSTPLANAIRWKNEIWLHEIFKISALWKNNNIEKDT